MMLLAVILAADLIVDDVISENCRGGQRLVTQMSSSQYSYWEGFKGRSESLRSL